MNLEFILFFFVSLAIVSFARALNFTQTKPGCQLKCGNVNIPYPFGVGANCSLGEWGNVHCNTTFNPPKPFIYKTVEVLQISTTEVRTRTLVAFACYNESGVKVNSSEYWWNFTGTPYTISSTKNKITAIGCDTSLFTYLNSNRISSGCSTSCKKSEDVIFEPCSGIGCCQMPVPNGMTIFSASVDSYWNHRKVWSFDPCSAAFIGEEGVYKLKMSDFSNTTSLEDIPMVLNFAVGNKTCKDAEKDSASYLCKENSYCYDAVDGAGYLCTCKKGYDGNPYLQHSCQGMKYITE
ncbi:hypothetical protein ACHQM5_009696 [Ranunculus cassubicifolius]